MAIKVIKKEQVVGKVDFADKDGTVIQTDEYPLGEIIVSDDEPMANVGVKLGRTKNTGNFESLRVDVSLFMPSATDKKSLNKTFKKCLKWADDKMDEVLN
jgi:hypothetical protein